MKGINVLSLFDGMSCGQQALERLGIKVDKYYASEIDPYAISVTQYNYPDTIQLGDIREIKGKDLGHIDLIVGGSPCQGFSFSQRNRLNFDDPRSALFFEYVRVLNECREINPDIFFLLENVRMSNKSKDVITKYMGVEPININSALVSAQSRNRLYWTNIPNVKQPQDRGIMLKDILLDGENNLPMYSNIYGGFGEKKPRVHYDKSVTIRTASGGGHIPSVTKVDDKYYLKQNQKDHVLDPTRLKKKYTAIDGDKALTLIGSYPRLNGTHVTVDDKYYLSEKMKAYILSSKFNNKGEINTDKAKCLTASYHKMQRSNMASYVSTEHQPLDKTNIRKLLPTETERLQTVEDNYTAYGFQISKSVKPSVAKNIMEQFKEIVKSDKDFYQMKADSGWQDNKIALKKTPSLRSGNSSTYVLDNNDTFRKVTVTEAERLQTINDNLTAKGIVDGKVVKISDTQRYKMIGNGWTVEVIVEILKNIIGNPAPRKLNDQTDQLQLFK